MSGQESSTGKVMHVVWPAQPPAPVAPASPVAEVAVPATRSRKAASPFPLGQTLVDEGLLLPGDLVRALALQQRQDARLGEILVTHGMISEKSLLRALARQWRTEVVSPLDQPPNPRLVDRWGAGACLRDGLLPWRSAGGVTVIATSRPELFMRQLEALEAAFGPVAQAICTEKDLRRAVERMRSAALVQAAETRVQDPFHCRDLGSGAARRLLLSAVIMLLSCLIAFPHVTLSVLTVWALATLVITACVRIGALVLAAGTALAPREATLAAATRDRQVSMARLPVISMLVPLYQEEDIAGRLLRRLERLSYPRELTDICLVVEAGDEQTRTLLARIDLPRWIRIVTVPEGAVRTKPRALNYALDFCRGSIVGVWDAEDAPAADQLHQVARRFHLLGPDVACLQGRLDFYNTRTNWLSRCFSLEYAAWFRVILPGMIRMGFAIPLGGTTLFFRRDALERIGAWDAHNVTEDADLGIRLARMGYRTEMVPTVTHEEANARVLPWIKQRSRWLKGYAMTYAVHMRNPARLWRDLGPWRFFGVQVVFLCTLSQFLLAPLLWSFWLLAFGMPHFLTGTIGPNTVIALAGLFVMSELVTLATTAIALRGLKRRWLLIWVPTLHVYFPLGAIAAYKGLLELVTRPFYWDKTAHGVFEETCPLTETGDAPGPLDRPVPAPAAPA